MADNAVKIEVGGKKGQSSLDGGRLVGSSTVSEAQVIGSIVLIAGAAAVVWIRPPEWKVILLVALVASLIVWRDISLAGIEAIQRLGVVGLRESGQTARAWIKYKTMVVGYEAKIEAMRIQQQGGIARVTVRNEGAVIRTHALAANRRNQIELRRLREEQKLLADSEMDSRYSREVEFVDDWDTVDADWEEVDR